MKKRFLPLLCLTLGAMALGAAGLKNADIIQTDASVNPYVLVEDDFNNSKYKGSLNTEVWTRRDVGTTDIRQSTVSDCYLMNNSGNNNVSISAIATNRKLSGIKSFQFDVKFSQDCVSGSNSKWVSVYFANDHQEMINDLPYDGIMRAAYNAMFNAGSTFDKENFNFVATLGTNLINDWLTIKIDVSDSVSGTINACIKGQEFVDTNKVSFTYGHGVNLQNAYVGVAVSNDWAAEIRMDNFVLEHDGVTISEDFSSCDPTDPESDFIYIVTEGRELSSCMFKVIDNSSLDFDQASANDYIYSNAEVTDPKGIVLDIDVIDLTFKVKINQNNYKLGIVFGFDPTTKELFKDTVVYEMGKYNGRLYEYDAEGTQVLPEATNKNTFTSLATETSIEIKINKKNGISIFENDNPVVNSSKAVTFSNVNNYYGNVAVVLLAKGSATPAVVSIDQFKLTTSIYYVPTTKSVTHNFSNDYWGNKDNPDFYVRDSHGAGKQTVKDGKLVWSRASDGTFFGSAYQYDNFILDFKVCSIYGDITVSDAGDITAKDKWIGLDLCREVRDSSTYSNYVNILTVITAGENYKTIPVWVNCNEFSPLKAEEVKRKDFNSIPLSLFRDITYSDPAAKGEIKAEDAVCFRYVSEGGNITMYLKKASDVEFTKIMTLYNLQMKGYFALCCTGYTFLEIDDFSMSNTSPVYVCADNDVPQTITEIITQVIYDNQNNPVNLKKEIRINSGLYLGLMIAFACTTVGAGTALTIVLVKNKKKKGVKDE